VNESVLIRGVLSLVACLTLAACVGGARVPEDNFYRLESVAPVGALTAPALQGILMIQGGTAAPVYRDRALLYSEPGSPERLQRYHYQYWIDSPPQLLQSGLADYLRTAGVARQVVLPQDSVDADFRLRVDIERFEHIRGQSSNRNGGQVAVELRVTLTERATGKLLMQTQLQSDTAVQGAEFTAVAIAYQQVMTELYGRILAQLAELD
jgi:ABC-type uncharacterized transport system auxiliary subunit